MKNDLTALALLIKRGVKMFLKDKAGVFFSLLAPLIVLVLYVLFLGDLQMSSIEGSFEGMNVDKDVLRSIVDGWMLSGAVSIACITVSFSAHNIMIRDREDGVVADMRTSPVKRWVLTAGYFCFNVCVTLAIVGIVFVIALIYIAATGWYLSFVDILVMLGLIILSVLSAALISTLICSLIKTGNAHGAFVGIMSAAIGFLVGAYMPLSMFPKAVQYIVLLIPGTYSAALFRNYFMAGALDELAKVAPPEAIGGVESGFSMKLDFFGTQIGVGEMWAILAGSVVLFAAILTLISFLRGKKRVRLANDVVDETQSKREC